MSNEVHEQLRRIVEGDREAAAWLYDSFASDLFRRLRQRYGRTGGLDPEDLLQDAFTFYFQRDAKVLSDFLKRQPPGGASRESLAGHLWDLACGVASNRRRSAWGRRVVPLADTERAAPEPDAEEGTMARDALERLDRCLRAGRARVYLYFKLRYVDALTADEVATVTGWSMKATYKLRQVLNEAIRRCAERLGL